MSGSRLSTLFDEGLLPRPGGVVTVMRPPVGADLAPLGRARVVTAFFPEHAWWSAMGHEVAQVAGPCDLAVVCVPRAKALARAMLAEAAAVAPRVVVDGQKTDGVDSLWRELRKRHPGGEVPSVTKAHGRAFWFDAGAVDLSDWAAPPPRRGPEGFFTQAGVFSEDAVDRGSALLAAALPARLPARMADLGAGWGYLSAAVLRREGVERIDLVEAEARALDCARLNVTDPRAAFHWADATDFKAPEPYDGIVCNPPFHQGRAADPELGRAFIASAARLLAPGGQLWLVANRHLPYEAALRAAFSRIEEVAGDGAFKVFHAARPKRDPIPRGA